MNSNRNIYDKNKPLCYRPKGIPMGTKIKCVVTNKDRYFDYIKEKTKNE